MSNLLDRLKILKTIQEQNKILDAKINEINKSKKQHPDEKKINYQKDIYIQRLETIIENRKNTDKKKYVLEEDLDKLEKHKEKQKQPTLLHNKEVKSFINEILLEESKNSNININYNEIEIDDTILLSILQSNDLQILNKSLKDINK